jgi:hypothetical protein
VVLALELGGELGKLGAASRDERQTMSLASEHARELGADARRCAGDEDAADLVAVDHERVELDLRSRDHRGSSDQAKTSDT